MTHKLRHELQTPGFNARLLIKREPRSADVIDRFNLNSGYVRQMRAGLRRVPVSPRAVAHMLESVDLLDRLEGLRALGRNERAIAFVNEHAPHKDSKDLVDRVARINPARAGKATLKHVRSIEPSLQAPPDNDSEFVKRLVAILKLDEQKND